MSLDLTTITGALYGRAAMDSAGSGVRALLGTFPAAFSREPALAGQPALFARHRLALFAGAGLTLPWLVWDDLGSSGQSGTVRSIDGTWWAYAPLHGGAYPLSRIATALDALYGLANALAVPGGRTSVTYIGRPFEDTALGVLGRETRIRYTQLG